MPNKVILQNFYRTTVTSASAIPLSGDFNFDVAVAPVNKNGFLILGSENISTRQIFYYHDVIGNTIYVRGVNRITAASVPVPTGYSVKMNDVSEIFNYFGDNLSTLFYVEKIGGLSVKVSGGYIMYNNNQISVADTTLALTDGTTNYIKYDAPTNTISADTTASGNIKCEVVCSSGAITSILYRTSKESYLDFAISITGALPSQGGNSGKALVTDGTNVSWGTPSLPRNIGVGKGVDVDRVTGLEVYRTVSDVTAIETDDIFRMRDADGTYNDITGAALKADLAISAHPIGSVRDSTIAGLFGAGYNLVSTAMLSGTDVFTSKTAMGTARYGSFGGVIGTKMYVVGGDNAVSGSFNTNEEYDFTLNTWSTKAVLTAGRSRSYHGVIGGKLYVIGGYSDVSTGTSHQSSSYEYDPVANSWTTKSSMATAQGDGASGVYNGRLYIIGGVDNSFTALNTVQYFDPVANTFTTGLATIPNARKGCYNHGVSIGNKIYVPGGQDSGGTAQTSNYEYTASADTWATKTVMLTAVHTGHFESCTIDGEVRIISISGFNGSSNTALVHEYSPTSNAWTARSTSASQRRGGAVVSYLNEIYYVGGYAAASTTAALDKYTPIKFKYEYERIS